jgi:hypothetical protein
MRARNKGTGITVPPGTGLLRFGLQGMAGQTAIDVDGVQHPANGSGASGDYRVIQFNPHADGLANLPTVLTYCQARDVLPLIMVAGSSTNYGGGGGGTNNFSYDSVAFTAQVNKVKTAGGTQLANMFRDKQAIGYFGDEPNAATWDPSNPGATGYSPAQWNGSARILKNLFPNGILTCGRLTPLFHRDGWFSFPGSSNPATWDAIDYGWLQYNASYRKNGFTIAGALDQEKSIGDTLNMGVGFSLNLVNGGHRTDLAGVAACWDYNFNGASSGVVVGSGGSDTPSGAPVTTDGQKITCASITGTTGGVGVNRNLLANPNWVRAAAIAGANRNWVPWMCMWTLVVGDGNDPSEAVVSVPYFNRNDWVLARQDAISIGAGRSNFTGLRTPKP